MSCFSPDGQPPDPPRAWSRVQGICTGDVPVPPTPPDPPDPPAPFTVPTFAATGYFSDSGACFAWSNDGSTWTVSKTPVNTLIYDTAYSRKQNRLMVVGSGNENTVNLAYTSKETPGENDWTPVSQRLANNAFSVFYSEKQEKWVVATGSGIYYSEDGDSWTKTTFDEHFWGVSYSYDQDVWMAGGEGTILRSPNGEDWTVVNASIFSNCTAVTYSELAFDGAKRWIAVGQGQTDAPRIAYSDDGFTWTAVVVKATPTSTLPHLDVAYSAPQSRWVIVGSDQMMYSDNNGLMWNIAKASDGTNFNTVIEEEYIVIEPVTTITTTTETVDTGNKTYAPYSSYGIPLFSSPEAFWEFGETAAINDAGNIIAVYARAQEIPDRAWIFTSFTQQSVGVTVFDVRPTAKTVGDAVIESETSGMLPLDNQIVGWVTLSENNQNQILDLLNDNYAGSGEVVAVTFNNDITYPPDTYNIPVEDEFTSIINIGGEDLHVSASDNNQYGQGFTMTETCEIGKITTICVGGASNNESGIAQTRLQIRRYVNDNETGGSHALTGEVLATSELGTIISPGTVSFTDESSYIFSNPPTLEKDMEYVVQIIPGETVNAYFQLNSIYTGNNELDKIYSGGKAYDVNGINLTSDRDAPMKIYKVESNVDTTLYSVDPSSKTVGSATSESTSFGFAKLPENLLGWWNLTAEQQTSIIDIFSAAMTNQYLRVVFPRQNTTTMYFQDFEYDDFFNRYDAVGDSADGKVEVYVEVIGGRGGKGSQKDRWAQGTVGTTTLKLAVGTEIFINVGGNGGNGTNSSDTRAPGGWNGGAAGGRRITTSPSLARAGGGGGGASSISLATGTIADIGQGNVTNILFVAGGGGGTGTGSASGMGGEGPVEPDGDDGVGSGTVGIGGGGGGGTNYDIDSPTGSGTGGTSDNGTSGGFGSGGQASDTDATTNPPGGQVGGGGGGGLWGGGAGSSSSDGFTGAGGGGGGASWVNPAYRKGISYSFSTTTELVGRVRISYDGGVTWEQTFTYTGNTQSFTIGVPDSWKANSTDSQDTLPNNAKQFLLLDTNTYDPRNYFTTQFFVPDAADQNRYKYDDDNSFGTENNASTLSAESQDTEGIHFFVVQSTGTFVPPGNNILNDDGITTTYRLVNDGITDAWIKFGNRIQGDNTSPGFAGDQMGFSMSMNESGSIMALGCGVNTSVDQIVTVGGQYVRVFQYNESNDTWEPYGQRLESGLYQDTGFGLCVKINSAGTVLAVGAPGTGFVDIGFVRIYRYVFNSSSGLFQWEQVGQMLTGTDYGDNYGTTIGMNSTGDKICVGAYEGQVLGRRGYVKAYEFDPVAEKWVQYGNTIAGTVDDALVGRSVDFDQDGTSVVVASGTLITGNVTIYDYDDASDVWLQRGSAINSTKTGSRVKISNDGNIVASNGFDTAYVEIYQWKPTETQTVVVSNTSGGVDTITWNLPSGTDPSITVTPASAVLKAGESATFTFTFTYTQDWTIRTQQRIENPGASSILYRCNALDLSGTGEHFISGNYADDQRTAQTFSVTPQPDTELISFTRVAVTQEEVTKIRHISRGIYGVGIGDVSVHYSALSEKWFAVGANYAAIDWYTGVFYDDITLEAVSATSIDGIYWTMQKSPQGISGKFTMTGTSVNSIPPIYYTPESEPAPEAEPEANEWTLTEEDILLPDMEQRKGNILQYKDNSSNLTNQERYAQIMKGSWTNRTKTFATQSVDYTNPNTHGFKRVNYTSIYADDGSDAFGAPITCPEPPQPTPIPEKLPDRPLPPPTPKPKPDIPPQGPCPVYVDPAILALPPEVIPIEDTMPVRPGTGAGNIEGLPYIKPVPVPPPRVVIPNGGSFVCIREGICAPVPGVSLLRRQPICTPTTASNVPGTEQLLCYNSTNKPYFPRRRYKMTNSGNKFPTGYKFT